MQFLLSIVASRIVRAIRHGLGLAGRGHAHWQAGGLTRLFMDHPPLDERIAAMQIGGMK